jgi:hypothetical protein
VQAGCLSHENDGILRAYGSGEHSMEKIGDCFGLVNSMVTRIIKNSRCDKLFENYLQTPNKILAFVLLAHYNFDYRMSEQDELLLYQCIV